MTEKKIYENELITHTINASEILSNVEFEFATVQADFYLSSADFLRLKDDRSWPNTLSVQVFFGIVGWVISLSPKMVNQIRGSGETITIDEWVIIAGGLAVCAIFRLLGSALPSEKKKVMKAIEDHFRSMPKTRQPIKGGK
ncbi:MULTISPECIES: hypothetical protein [unclassified Pseudomonas]|uniref:hypothetical protein n=1 Tax=unclassified Pseudomonas TaxID=196821 RepID=UPI00224B277B|nr:MULTISPECIES: hypothetical protein [unclassified Pseudomonas]MCX2817442.1 hypothetical protein [Pseudomonas sp. DCB_E]MCX9145090.1 hypothetical protein [Pseudomonas sp. DCB_Q]